MFDSDGRVEPEGKGKVEGQTHVGGFENVLARNAEVE
jgi:hypothetical protein